MAEYNSNNENNNNNDDTKPNKKDKGSCYPDNHILCE